MTEPTNQPPRTNRKMVLLVAVAGLLLCVATAVAGFAIGRASISPQATAVLETTDQETAAASANGAADAANERETAAEEAASTSANEESADEESVDEETVDEESAVETAPVESNEAGAPAQPTAVPTAPPQQTEAPAEPLDLDALDFELLLEVWREIEADYYGELPSNDELIYAMIEGSLDALDDEYTRFVRPDVAQLLREDFGGSVEGVGAFVRENDDGFVEIVAPIEGQPAELVGLLPGDLVVAVDGVSVVGEDFYGVIAKIRGPRGTDVTLTIERAGAAEPLEFTITRVRFEVPIVEAELLPENIGYVQLTEFGANAYEQINTAVTDLLAQNPDGIILDLRNNPGGIVDQSVLISDLFLPQGVVLYQRDSAGGERVYSAEDGDLAEEVPLVVLVNEASASASEIVAGALQDNGRAVLIGDATFGKGSVQLLNQLSDGSELRVTIARWYTPNNTSINQEGITPDIIFAEDFETETDEQLQRAIDYFVEGE